MRPIQTSPAAGQHRDLGAAQLQGRAAGVAMRLRHSIPVFCAPHVCLSYLQEAQQQQPPPVPQLAQLARHTAHLGHQAHKLQGSNSAGQTTHLHTMPSSRPSLHLLDQAALQAQRLQIAGVRGLSDRVYWRAACLRISEERPRSPAEWTPLPAGGLRSSLHCVHPTSSKGASTGLSCRCRPATLQVDSMFCGPCSTCRPRPVLGKSQVHHMPPVRPKSAHSGQSTHASSHGGGTHHCSD